MSNPNEDISEGIMELFIEAPIVEFSKPINNTRELIEAMSNPQYASAIMSVGFNTLSSAIHRIALEKGWYSNPDGTPKEMNFGERIALMHSELSEALEAHRKGNPPYKHLPEFDGMTAGLGDAIIRILDTATYHGLPLLMFIVAKCEYNLHREDHKMENRLQDGGKKY